MKASDDFTTSSGALAPSGTRKLIDLRTTNQSMTTAHLGSVVALQTGPRMYPRATLPAFAGVTVGTRASEVEVLTPLSSVLTGVFNKGTDGTDPTLEAVLAPGADVNFKATASSAFGAINKIGVGAIRSPFPLFTNPLTVDLGVTTLSASQSIVTGSHTGQHQKVMLTGTVGLCVYVDSSNDIIGIAFSLNADGSERAASAPTTLRGNANTLMWPCVCRVTDTIAFIFWGDASGTPKNEYAFATITGGASPSITLGAVGDDTGVTAADRLYINASLGTSIAVPDYNSNNNAAVWVSGPMLTTAGAKVYRISCNTGTLAATLNDDHTYSTDDADMAQGGLSPAADKFIIGARSGSYGAIKYLSYAAGTISEVWSKQASYTFYGSGSYSSAFFFEIDSAREIIGIFSTSGFIAMNIDLSNGNIRWVKQHLTAGVGIGAQSPWEVWSRVVNFSGELLSFRYMSQYGSGSLDLLSSNVMGAVKSGATSPDQNSDAWNRFVLPRDHQVQDGYQAYSKHDGTRRFVMGQIIYSIPSGNLKLELRSYAWPRR